MLFGKTRYDEEQASHASIGRGNCDDHVSHDDDLLFKNPMDWYPHLELTRIICVFFVAVDHGDGSFSNWNVMFVQNWVFQYLFLTVGVCFGLSRKSLGSYLSRLLQYLVVGVGCNWAAFVHLGMDWQHDFFNVVFQMWFVVGVMIISILLSPLKLFLVRLRSDLLFSGWQVSEAGAEESSSRLGRAGSVSQALVPYLLCLKAFVFTGLGICAVWVLALFVATPIAQSRLAPALETPPAGELLGPAAKWWGFSPGDSGEAQALVRKAAIWIASSLTSVWIVVSLSLMVKDTTIVSWVVYINIYLNRLLLARGPQERFLHAIDLTLLGLVCYYLGMKGRRRVGDVLLRYWWLGLILVCSLWPPGTHGRQDVTPPQDFLRRTRFCLIEATMVLFWLTVGERVVDVRLFSEDNLGFLTEWALLIYLVHNAVHLVVPHPFNWLVLAALVPICFVWRRWYRDVDDDPEVTTRLFNPSR